VGCVGTDLCRHKSLMEHSTPRNKLIKIDPEHIFEHFAECRYYIGNFFEEATKEYYGAVRLSTIGSVDICPDHQLDETTFFECKSVGRNGNSILYASQLEKHSAFVSTGKQLYYVFWLHQLDVSTCISVGELHAGLARSLRKVIVVPLEVITRATEGRQQRTLNYRGRVGLDGKWVREKDMKGWQVRPNKLPKPPPMTAPELRVYDVVIPKFPIYQPFELDERLAARDEEPF
jgi:hypothetical protein